MAGHLMAAQSVEPLEFSLIALLVSGGHTSWFMFLRLVTTRLLGKREMTQLVKYDRLAVSWKRPILQVVRLMKAEKLIRASCCQFRAMIKEDNLEFSFSGFDLPLSIFTYAEQRNV